MSEEPEPLAYVGIAPCCGGLKFAGVDMPEAAKSNAQEVAWCVRQGYAVKMLTCAEVRRMPWCRCKPKTTGQVEPELF